MLEKLDMTNGDLAKGLMEVIMDVQHQWIQIQIQKVGKYFFNC